MAARRIVLALATVMLVTSCSGNGDNTPSPAARRGDASGTRQATSAVEAGVLRDRECGYDPVIEGARCHWLDVREDRGARNGRTISLAVTVLVATGPDRQADPIVYLHGGPGGDAVGGARGWSDEPMRTSRDIVLWDQRGAGASKPSLDCPEVDDDIRANFRSIETFEEMVERRTVAVKQCRARLVRTGIDLDQYDSETSAADLESLRLALGVNQWNLLGISYGTRLSLAYMRSFPDSVRSALLDSVYPPTVGKVAHLIDGAKRGIKQLTEGCLADDACAARFPDFATAVDRAAARLDAQPYRGDVDLGPENGGVNTLEVNGSDALAGLFTALYDADLIAALPSIIEGVAAGNYGVIPAVAQQGIPFATQFADGAAYSVDCADNAGASDRGAAELLANPGRFGVLLAEQTGTYCDVWDVEPTSARFNRAVHSDIPALVMAGTYDPVTPPADSETAAETLANATYVLVDGIGHSVFGSDPCGVELYDAFVANPKATLDLACAQQHPGPSFNLG